MAPIASSCKFPSRRPTAAVTCTADPLGAEKRRNMKTTTIAGITTAALMLAFGLFALARGSNRTVDDRSTRSTTHPTPIPTPTMTDSAKTETAILAGGCFWGMEEIIRKIPGVVSTTVGYTGGAVKNPSYEQICTGGTGHAEGVQVGFDPSRLTYEQLLGYFFRMHDPTTLNRQHNDVGTQYRSAIFYQDDAQKQTAEKVKAQVDKSGRFKRPMVTEITPASEFYPGEAYHQKYLVKNPGGYNCHILRD